MALGYAVTLDRPREHAVYNCGLLCTPWCTPLQIRKGHPENIEDSPHSLFGWLVLEGLGTSLAHIDEFLGRSNIGRAGLDINASNNLQDTDFLVPVHPFQDEKNRNIAGLQLGIR